MLIEGRDSLRVVIGTRSVHNRPVVSLDKPLYMEGMKTTCPVILLDSLCSFLPANQKEEKPSNSLKLELNGQPGQPSRTSFVI